MDIEESLSHHGVKGQKWGVRKLTVSNREVREAKGRQATRASLVRKAPDEKTRAKALKDFQTNEDRVTAARVSRGQALAWSIMAGPIGLAVVAAGAAQASQIAQRTDKARMKK